MVSVQVLRLYPAIPIFPREALAEDVLPSGDRVLAGAHMSSIETVVQMQRLPRLAVQLQCSPLPPCNLKLRATFAADRSHCWHFTPLARLCSREFLSSLTAGDVVFMSSYALGRSPALWEDASAFRPVRGTWCY